jgi:hypothetical protein
MKRFILPAIFSFCVYVQTFAQGDGYEYPENIHVLYGVLFNGEIIPVLNIPEISITGHKFNNQQDEYWYNYYLKRVTKVYPYFEIARTVILELDDKKDDGKKKDYKKFKKERKEALMNKFEAELRDLKVSEGKVLVKMINRETGTAFYDLIKEYNSGVKAWGYNLIANKYGYDLKDPYDPNSEENRMLELAIQQVLNNNTLHGAQPQP